MSNNLSNAVRILGCDQIRNAKSGHTGIVLGASDVLTELFKNHLVFNPNDPKWEGRDRFILSAGHGSAMLYAILYLSGYKDLSIEDLKSFRQLNSKCAGHPESVLLAGVEVSTGPLGQGIANAVGIALGQKILTERYGELFNSKTYCLVGDGCLMEGISYEASSFAGYHKLNNLIIIHDDNKITIDGSVDITTSEDIKMRFKSCDFEVLECNGHDIDDINRVFNIAKKSTKPVFIQAHTKIGYLSLKEGSNKIHGSPLTDEEYDDLKLKLNWNSNPFEVEDDILKEWRGFWKRNEEQYNKWQEEYKKHKQYEEINDFFNKKLNFSNETKKELIDVFNKTDKEATRKSSGKVLEKIIIQNKNVLGGSADLDSSIMTFNSGCKVITKDNKSGNYIHYGIREHSMGAIMNGLASIGFIHYSGTFLVFSDYYKNSIRMSALMNLPVIHILTHDSFFVGEDGATHQPIEQLDCLRLIPNLLVFRPCDMEETIVSYDTILKLKKPSALVLSRQNLPQIKNKNSKIENGAYTIYSTKKEDECDITILSSGSEVSLSIETAKNISNKGYSVRVVSIYCYEILKKLSIDVKNKILYNNSKKIVAIEAGTCSVLGCLVKDGLVINIEEFGKSAKGEDLAELYCFTPEKCEKKIINFFMK